jgi:hypothetical protein
MSAITPAQHWDSAPPTSWRDTFAFLVEPILAGQPYIYRDESDLHWTLGGVLQDVGVPASSRGPAGPGDQNRLREPVTIARMPFSRDSAACSAAMVTMLMRHMVLCAFRIRFGPARLRPKAGPMSISAGRRLQRLCGLQLRYHEGGETGVDSRPPRRLVPGYRLRRYGLCSIRGHD